MKTKSMSFDNEEFKLEDDLIDVSVVPVRKERQSGMKIVMDEILPIALSHFHELILGDDAKSMARLVRIFESDSMFDVKCGSWEREGPWRKRAITGERKLTASQAMFGGKFAHCDVTMKSAFSEGRIVVEQHTIASGFMYSDCFETVVDWDVVSVGEGKCRIVAAVKADFTKSTIWKGTIVKNVESDVGKFFVLLRDSLLNYAVKEGSLSPVLFATLDDGQNDVRKTPDEKVIVSVWARMLGHVLDRKRDFAFLICLMLLLFVLFVDFDRTVQPDQRELLKVQLETLKTLQEIRDLLITSNHV